jgi:hypothetical protein
MNPSDVTDPAGVILPVFEPMRRRIDGNTMPTLSAAHIVAQLNQPLEPGAGARMPTTFIVAPSVRVLPHDDG